MLLAPSVVAFSRTVCLRSLRAHPSQLRRTSLFGHRQNSLSSFDVSQFWASREFCVVGLHASAKQAARGKRVVSLVEREREKKKSKDFLVPYIVYILLSCCVAFYYIISLLSCISTPSFLLLLTFDRLSIGRLAAISSLALPSYTFLSLLIERRYRKSL